jgi:hypothetical protein
MAIARPPSRTRVARSSTDCATSNSPHWTAMSAASAAGVSGSNAARCWTPAAPRPGSAPRAQPSAIPSRNGGDRAPSAPPRPRAASGPGSAAVGEHRPRLVQRAGADEGGHCLPAHPRTEEAVHGRAAGEHAAVARTAAATVAACARSAAGTWPRRRAPGRLGEGEVEVARAERGLARRDASSTAGAPAPTAAANSSSPPGRPVRRDSSPAAVKTTATRAPETPVPRRRRAAARTLPPRSSSRSARARRISSRVAGGVRSSTAAETSGIGAPSAVSRPWARAASTSSSSAAASTATAGPNTGTRRSGSSGAPRARARRRSRTPSGRLWTV